MFLPTEQYEVYLTPIGKDPGPVVQPPGSGWDLVEVMDHSGMFLWRRSRIYGEFEASETEQAEGRHRVVPVAGPIVVDPGATPAVVMTPFVPPPSQRQRLKVPKGVFDD